MDSTRWSRIAIVLWLSGLGCVSAKLRNCDLLSAKQTVTNRLDYSPSPYQIQKTSLTFKLDFNQTIVTSELELSRAPEHNVDLILDGSNHISFESGSLKFSNGSEFNLEEVACYQKELESLRIAARVLAAEENFRVKLNVTNSPVRNTHLFGLYVADDVLVTQNEALGFRRITFYLDRPDVLSVFNVTLEGKFPLLLSNGNREYFEERPDGVRVARFFDPVPKPSYLFALVAGDLRNVTDHVIVGRPCEESLRELFSADPQQASHMEKFCQAFPNPQVPPGDPPIPRRVEVAIWGKEAVLNRLDWALESVKKAMLWDEVRYGRVYDLDQFHVVSVRDFNAGAMENKGLNVFNYALIQTQADISTDEQFVKVQAVIAHEYFHNWSGDKVTVRDWFQLTLKEGFTVFRDQQFTQDMFQDAAERIQNIQLIEDVQFAEDASALKHPIRPDQYASIENFYTTTVYDKGAEVVRMYQTILGWQKFREGTDDYFATHVHRGATCEDFKTSLEKVSGIPLDNFFRWYNTSGTPVVRVLQRHWNSTSQKYSIKLSQQGESAEPLEIPIRMKLRSKRDASQELLPEVTLVLAVQEGVFEFENVPEEPIPSILRDFSAPVVLEPFLGKEELLALAMHDDDVYIRWKSSQEIFRNAVLQNSTEEAKGLVGHFMKECKAARAGELRSLLAMMLVLPSLRSMEKFVKPFDPVQIQKRIDDFRLKVFKDFEPDLQELYATLKGEDVTIDRYLVSTHQIGQRNLKNAILAILNKLDEVRHGPIAALALQNSPTENDRAAALSVIANWQPSPGRATLLQNYFEKNQAEDLLVDRWLAAQARSRANDTVDNVLRLMKLPLFAESTTPNRLRALLRSFSANLVAFHEAGGRGYELVANESLRWDGFNPKLGASLASVFSRTSSLPEKNKVLIKRQLLRLKAAGLSINTAEIVEKALGALRDVSSELAEDADEL